jgi:hypothetical protein
VRPAQVPTTTTPSAPAAPALAVDGGQLRALVDAKLLPSETQRALADKLAPLCLRWGEKDAHKEWVSAAAVVDELAFAGQVYRLAIEADGADAMAKVGRDLVLGQAVARLEGSRVVVEADGGRAKKLVLGVALLALAVVAIVVLVENVVKLLAATPS